MSAAPDVGTTRATADVSLSELPLRAELRGAQPYGAPQHDVPVRLNTNENPYPPSATIAREIGEAAARAARSLNRYPDREAYRLREDLARYLGYGLHASEIWAANGSNEVMLHMLQAFAGPGRTVLSFAPTYSMYPEYARDTHSAWVVGRRRDDFSLDPEHAIGLIVELQPAVVLFGVTEQPDRYRPADRSGRAHLRGRARHGGGGRGVRRVPPIRCAERTRPPGHAAAARGDPDDEQSIRIRRRPRRLPGSGTSRRGRSAYRPIAVSPVGGDAGDGPGGVGARRRAAGPSGRAARAAGCDRCVATWPGTDRGGLRRELRAVRRVR